MTYTERFLALVDRYCQLTGMTREQVSYRVFRDQRRLGRVADGTASITVRSLDNALGWLSDAWPDGAEWPAIIDRPLPAKAAS